MKSVKGLVFRVVVLPQSTAHIIKELSIHSVSMYRTRAAVANEARVAIRKGAAKP